MAVNSPTPCDSPYSSGVKKSALEELAKSLQAKASHHIAESEEANQDLKEIQDLIKKNEAVMKRAEMDEAAKEARDAAAAEACLKEKIAAFTADETKKMKDRLECQKKQARDALEAKRKAN